MTREELVSYRGLVLQLNQIEQMLARLEDKKAGAGAAGYGTQTGKNGISDRTAALAGGWVDLIAAYKSKQKELIAAIKKIETAIDKLDPVLAALIRARYVQGKKWEAIAYEMNYSWQHTHRLHRYALDLLTKVKDESK